MKAAFDLAYHDLLIRKLMTRYKLETLCVKTNSEVLNNRLLASFGTMTGHLIFRADFHKEVLWEGFYIVCI
jgi:hypothetical protein